MASPFPGMDPYLEGYLWADVHHRLATEIADRLTPYLRPRYVARLEIYVVQDTKAAEELGIFYPDVEVVLAAGARTVREPAAVLEMGATAEEVITTPPLIGAALAAIYERAAYDLSIDYKAAPPPPPLSAEEEAWVQHILV